MYSFLFFFYWYPSMQLSVWVVIIVSGPRQVVQFGNLFCKKSRCQSSILVRGKCSTNHIPSHPQTNLFKAINGQVWQVRLDTRTLCKHELQPFSHHRPGSRSAFFWGCDTLGFLLKKNWTPKVPTKDFCCNLLSSFIRDFLFDHFFIEMPPLHWLAWIISRMEHLREGYSWTCMDL